MNIGWAIAHMQSTIGGGRKCRRAAWPSDCWIHVQKPDAHSKMTEPYIYLGDGIDRPRLAPWIPSQADLLADDYEWFAPAEDDGA
jgi:uncharacterized protein DUF2829